MRISMTRGIRKKCASMYFEETTCPLPECDNPTEDHQHHLLTCSSLKSYLNQQEILKLSLIEYEDIYGSLDRQKAAILVFSWLLDARDRLLEAAKPASGASLDAAPTPGSNGVHANVHH